MKLTFRDTGSFLTKRPNVAAVLIYGPDHGLVLERSNILGKFVVPDLNDPFNVAVMTGAQVADDPARFLDETRALSMMGGDRLIKVTEAVDSISATLKSYLAAPSPATLVIIEAAECPPKSPLRKLFETAPNAVALPCYVEDAQDLVKLIGSSVRDAGLRIDQDALDFLAQAIGGDRAQVRSEVEKLLTYMGADANGKASGTVTYDDAVACSGAMGLANLDSFVDAFLLGDVDGAMTLLKRLEDDGMVMIAILRTLLAYGRKLESTHLQIADGESLSAILESKAAPVFFKRKNAFTQQIRLWPLPRLRGLMNEFLNLEAKMKSGVDPDIVIPQALMSLCARATRPDRSAA
jgi:DNA polymerase III subunit delta